MFKSIDQHRLSLMPGDLVEVRSYEEIAATLDKSACLDKLPFMPEMAQYCGRQFRVYRRADKTCDTVNQTGGRRTFDTVHLEDVRCDGSEHGGCQALCLIFWKEAWLKRASSVEEVHDREVAPDIDLVRHACTDDSADGEATIYRCQATALPEFTTLLHWWDIRQYFRDLKTGNTTLGRFVRILCLAAFRAMIRIGIGTRALIFTYNKMQTLRGGQPYPTIKGTQSNTPADSLNLQPGEMVRIKPLEEIVATLDKNSKNRGMRFDPEMAKFCGGTYRVAQRVDKIIEEHTGRMLNFATPSVILDNVFCHSEFSSCRLFCPRSIFSYWRENWLERVPDPVDT